MIETSAFSPYSAPRTTVKNKMVVTTFPRLFKMAASGKVQYWDVFAQEVPPLTNEGEQVSGDPKFGEIVTIYGQIGTLNPQRTVDVVRKGKNIGKVNETTPYDQAVKEAQAKWEKQKKRSGYVDKEADLYSEADSAEGVFPMLAEKFRDYPEKIAWPCYVQPKLNGNRCVAVVVNGKATLWSKKKNPITSMPHIVAELEAKFKNIVLDGELFNEEINQNNPDYDGPRTQEPMTLQELNSYVRSKQPKGRYQHVQYHVYDIINEKQFVDRNDELASAMATVIKGIVVPVMTGMASCEDDVWNMFSDVRKNGYEGLMLRNAEGKYLSHPTRRSKDILKVKKTQEGDYSVVDIEEGRGKLAGHVGAFWCADAEGKLFKAKMDGEQSFLKKCFNDHSLWQGKILTVHFAELTDDGLPFHGVATDLRSPEEV